MDDDIKLKFDPEAVVVSERVVIHAPRETVWSVLVDFANYGSWNPFA